MINNEQYIIPKIRIFKIENIPRIKFSLVNQKSKLDINRLFIPIESNLLTENIFDRNTQQNSLINIPSTTVTDETEYNKAIFRQSIMNTIDHRQVILLIEKNFDYLSLRRDQLFYDHIYNIEQKLPSSTIVSENFIPNEHLIINTYKTTNSPLSSVKKIDPTLTRFPPVQLVSKSIINEKQATNRIFDEEKNSKDFTQSLKLPSINSTENNKTFETNLIRYYQIGSIFTSTTNTFLMHKNEVIAAHSTTNSDPFFSETFFIILIAILTLIILLFCLGLFCLCRRRRQTKRNISPSFDAGSSSYIELNDQLYSPSIPSIKNYQKEMNIPLKSSLLTNTNDQIPLIEPIALHQTIKPKLKLNNKKLKKKRLGFCCCNKSKQSSITTINARTRI